MFNVIRFATQVLLFILAFMIMMLGLNWLDPEIGQGLHPAIAFPIAFFIFAFVTRSIIMDIRHENRLHELDRFIAKRNRERGLM
jgi:hypothetical protein